MQGIAYLEGILEGAQDLVLEGHLLSKIRDLGFGMLQLCFEPPWFILADEGDLKGPSYG